MGEELSCSEIRKYYDKYFNRLLSKEKKSSVQKHLANCHGCRTDYLDLLHRKFVKDRENYSSIY